MIYGVREALCHELVKVVVVAVVCVLGIPALAKRCDAAP
jgi:hypothetical protein